MFKSKTECSRTVDNKYYNNPGIMADGRAFTDYRSSRDVNELIAMKNNSQPSNSYHDFLTHRGVDIIRKTEEYISDKLQMGTLNFNDIKTAQACTINMNGSVFCSAYNTDDYSIGTNWQGAKYEPVINVPVQSNKLISENIAFPNMN